MMELDLAPGRYVVAVSGGVDSMALLHMLRNHPDLQLIVAHYDHGIRYDSDQDRRLVQDAARRYGLQFVYDKGTLGADASEDVARKARYDFLQKVKHASTARALITAHHQDDLLETAIHNMLRGTGRRGLIALRSRPGLERPLLHMPKSALVSYAQDQGLAWNEDSTNTNLQYARNYIRHVILPKFSEEQKQELLQHIRTINRVNTELEYHLDNHLHLHPRTDQLDRHWFIMLPHTVAREVLLTWLRRHGVEDITSKTLERLIVAAKTFAPGRQADIDKKYILQITSNRLAITLRDR